MSNLQTFQLSGTQVDPVAETERGFFNVASPAGLQDLL